MLWAVSLSTMKLCPHRLTATLTLRRIRSLADLSNPERAHQPTSSSTPPAQHVTLHLNAFRGERAITEFDWPFTPTPSSSPRFPALVGSGLHTVVPALHPGHG